MNRGLALGAGLGIGTGVMYLFDPDRGRRRRALLRDKLMWIQRKTGECIQVTSRDLSNRTSGIAASIQSRFASDEASDVVLAERVRSKLGRIVAHPGAIEVAVGNGNVSLSGPILKDEVAGLMSCVKWIPGVKGVSNNLEVHEEAGNHPALQGGRERKGYEFEFLQENWSPSARLIAGVAGASLAVYGGTRRDALGAGIGAAGVLLLTRGITNTEFRSLAGLGDEQKADDERTSPAHDGSSVESLFAQNPAAV